MRTHDLLIRVQNYLVGDDPAGVPAGPGGIPAAIAPSYYNRRVVVGRKYIPTMLKGSPPYVILAPRGGKSHADTSSAGRDFTPRVLRSAEVIFDAYCWGKDYDQAEMLEAAILTACFQATDATDTYIDSNEWLDDAQDTAGEILHTTFRVGGFYIQEIKLPLGHPIEDNILPTVTLDAPSTDLTGGLNGPIVSWPVEPA